MNTFTIESQYQITHLYNSDKYSDFIIKYRDNEISVHRCIISIIPFFDMYIDMESTFADKQMIVCDIEQEINPWNMDNEKYYHFVESIIRYTYGYPLDIAFNDLVDMIKIIDYMNYDDLVQIIKEKIHENIDIFGHNINIILELYQHFDFQLMDKFIDECLKYVNYIQTTSQIQINQYFMCLSPLGKKFGGRIKSLNLDNVIYVNDINIFMTYLWLSYSNEGTDIIDCSKMGDDNYKIIFDYIKNLSHNITEWTDNDLSDNNRIITELNAHNSCYYMKEVNHKELIEKFLNIYRRKISYGKTINFITGFVPFRTVFVEKIATFYLSYTEEGKIEGNLREENFNKISRLRKIRIMILLDNNIEYLIFQLHSLRHRIIQHMLGKGTTIKYRGYDIYHIVEYGYQFDNLSN